MHWVPSDRVLTSRCSDSFEQVPLGIRASSSSVKLLTKLAQGDKSALPEGGFMDIPARNIRKDNVNEFWTELKKLTGDAEESAEQPEEAGDGETAAEEKPTEEKAEDKAADKQATIEDAPAK